MTYPDINLTRPYGLFQYANTVTNSMFGIVIIILAFIILMASMSRFGIKHSFAASSFVTLLLTIMFRLLSIVSDAVVFVMIFLTVIGLATLIFGGE